MVVLFSRGIIIIHVPIFTPLSLKLTFLFDIENIGVPLLS